MHASVLLVSLHDTKSQMRSSGFTYCKVIQQKQIRNEKRARIRE
jgi:hypothetical protein